MWTRIFPLLLLALLVACDRPTDDPDDPTPTPVPAKPGTWQAWAGKALRPYAYGGTTPQAVSNGTDLFVYYTYNRGFGQTTGYLTRVADTGAHPISSYLNAPAFGMTNGPGNLLHTVEEDVTVSGSFPATVWNFRYLVKKWNGSAFADLPVPAAGKDAWLNFQLCCDNTTLYFCGKTPDGLRVLYHDGTAWQPVPDAAPVAGTASQNEVRYFRDGADLYAMTLAYANGVGTATILKIRDKAATVVYSGAVNLNQDRQFFAYGGKLHALRYANDRTDIVRFPEGTAVWGHAAPFEIARVFPTDDALVYYTFEDGIPDAVFGSVFRYRNGSADSLGRATSPAMKYLSDFRGQYGHVSFFLHNTTLFGLVDHTVAAGAVNVTDLVLTKYVP